MRGKHTPLLLILGALMANPLASAQMNITTQGGRNASLGGCFVSLQDAQSSLTGCACRSDSSFLAIGSANSYMMPGMTTSYVGGGAGLHEKGAVTASLAYFGDAVYNEQQIVLGYSLPITPALRIGISGDYYRQGAEDTRYDPRHWLGAAAGLQADLGEVLTLGIFAQSRPYDTTNPCRLQAGFAYRPATNFMTTAELEFTGALNLHAGIEYSYREVFFFRAGFSTRPQRLTFGIGVHWRRLEIDLATMSHSVLGLSPQISATLWL